MKIIFSRKGFDSTSGGKPSLVVENKIITFPIPQANTGVFYKDLLTPMGVNYDTLFHDIGIHQFSEAHVDPDLNPNIYGTKRPKGWRGVFGQDDSSQTHLSNENVCEKDLFLFFGWFQFGSIVNGKYAYTSNKKNPEGFHMLWGFLETGKPIKVENDKIPEWASKHTHVINKHLQDNSNNTLYPAAEASSIGLKETFGIFTFSEDLILSNPGKRSNWKLDKFFKNKKISHHGKDAKINDPNHFQSVGRGQEFVFEESKEIEKWAVGLINNHL
ncbi:MAG: hypothetical protein CFE24_14750 [Flavobacterium sp. BFFFF2]|nr:MAG: hypothetical protein CFE24_14750 [Flavobacterium sp. BFFFF2]